MAQSKLSRQQETILIMLLHPERAATQREFNQQMYDMFWEHRKNIFNARAALSRVYRHLEDRGLITKHHRRWLLTEEGAALANKLFAEVKKQAQERKQSTIDKDG
jgi:hypothetical protein